MPLDDPATWIKGATALKTAFDSVRSAISMVRDVRALGGGSPQQQKAIDTALRVCPKTSGGITKFSEHEAD
jgi:hypothetical protein